MSSRQIIDIANAMIAQYGDEAIAVMEERAERNRHAGDQESGVMWAQVAKAVRALQADARPK